MWDFNFPLLTVQYMRLYQQEYNIIDTIQVSQSAYDYYVLQDRYRTLACTIPTGFPFKQISLAGQPIKLFHFHGDTLIQAML